MGTLCLSDRLEKHLNDKVDVRALELKSHSNPTHLNNISQFAESILVSTFNRIRFDHKGQITNSFKRLSPQALGIVLSGQELKVNSENDVFAAVVQWLQFD